LHSQTLFVQTFFVVTFFVVIFAADFNSNIMETPFVFGKIATDLNFTDREQETAWLVQNFTSLINTIIISPRRWGKSSLVHKAANVAMNSDKDLRVCSIDLFNVLNEAHFYEILAEKVLAATSTKWDEAVELAKQFFSRLVPKISIGTDPMNEVSVDFNWDDVKRNPDEVLDLAENIAIEKDIKIVICIDEFQNIANFSNADYFQKKLRSHWQRHQHVAYCLFGSKRHMMLDIFTNSSMPFYKFGNIIFLKKIETQYLTDFINKRFTETQKSIDQEASQLIVGLTENHPYYAQQLAQLSWLRTNGNCTVETVRAAHSTLVEQLSLLFTTLTETLSSQQVYYLKALLAGEKAISSTAVMHKYHLTSTTSVSRSKDALIKNDVLDKEDKEISFQDPIYKYWLKHEFFNL
jgi:hypothetical protein